MEARAVAQGVLGLKGESVVERTHRSFPTEVPVWTIECHPNSLRLV